MPSETDRLGSLRPRLAILKNVVCEGGSTRQRPAGLVHCDGDIQRRKWRRLAHSSSKLELYGIQPSMAAPRDPYLSRRARRRDAVYVAVARRYSTTIVSRDWIAFGPSAVDAATTVDYSWRQTEHLRRG